jgi:(heptosyl)LPS beta-1,4-glucosyltransferase
VHESVRLDNPFGYLRNELQHYSVVDLQDHADRINLYSTLGARQMDEAGRRARALDLLVQPPAAFFRSYILRRGFLDGTPGLTLAMMHAHSVFLKFAKLWELRHTPRN